MQTAKNKKVRSDGEPISLRVHAKISSQILSVEAPAWQGAKVQEYQAYSELSQRSQAGCIGAQNVKLFLREPLAPGGLRKMAESSRWQK